MSKPPRSGVEAEGGVTAPPAALVASLVSELGFSLSLTLTPKVMDSGSRLEVARGQSRSRFLTPPAAVLRRESCAEFGEERKKGSWWRVERGHQ